MSSKIITKYLQEGEYAEWNKFVSNSRDGSIYSTPEYLDALCTAAGGHFNILATLQSDEIVGGVALYERKSLSMSYVVPRLLLYYNSFVFRNYETKYPSKATSHRLKVMAALEQTLSTSGYSSIRIKCHSSISDVRFFLQSGWNAIVTYTYIVSIKDINLAWNRVEQNLRRLVNRCAQQGVQLSEDDDFDSFYELHRQTHERKGAPLYLSRDAFHNFYKKLRSQNLCCLYHARLPEGRSISTQLVLTGPHATTHTVCAGADENYLNLGANAFLRWKVFEDLSKSGYVANDLTDAALNPVSHFKSQLGGDLKSCLVLFRRESLPFRAVKEINYLSARCKDLIKFILNGI